MAGDIANICQQLGAAVELTMNPSVPMEQRHQVSNVKYQCYDSELDILFSGI